MDMIHPFTPGASIFSYGPSEVLYLEPGCYIQDLDFTPLPAGPWNTDAWRYPPVILVGAGPESTIIVGRGTQDAVIRFSRLDVTGPANPYYDPNGPTWPYGYAGGEVHGLKIKPADGQDGIYFKANLAFPALYDTAQQWYEGQSHGRFRDRGIEFSGPGQMEVTNTIIEGGRNAVVLDATDSSDSLVITNCTIAHARGNALEIRGAGRMTARSNLIAWNQGAAFYPVADTAHFRATYNAIWANGHDNRGELPPDSQNVFVDPRIRREGCRITYRLSAGSPLNGAGLARVPPLVGDFLTYGSVDSIPVVYVPVDIGAYGKADVSAPTGTTLIMASRQQPRIDLGSIDPTDDVGVDWFIVETAPTPTGPWEHSHSMLGGLLGGFWWQVLVNPTTYPDTLALPWIRVYALDSSFNVADRNASNVVSPPSAPRPYQWAIYRDGTSCNSSRNVWMRFNPPSIPQVGGAIDQYEIWHCWRGDDFATCDYPPGIINTPGNQDTCYGMHVPCNSVAHYYFFRGREKVTVPPTGVYRSYSSYRTGGVPGTPVRICMVNPDT